MAEKKHNRCWPGYEPVKGKQPRSQGSCRPEAESKLTDSEKKFREKRKRQLRKWQAEHPHTRRSAAQHLHAPGANTKKSPVKAIKRMSAGKRKRRAPGNK
ncbi:MAG: hypothetical protein ACR2JB_02505 [Bryobacteraceae bacterium]